MSDADQIRWDEKYTASAAVPAPAVLVPDQALRETVTPLPPGRALEFACGLGENAVWLAEQGWQVDAVDISSVGLARARELADRQQVQVNWIAADLESWQPAEGAYDLVYVFRFLDRERLPGLMSRALKPGGWMIYETFSRAQCQRANNHLRGAEWTLEPGELPRLFPELEVISAGEFELADRSVSRLIARRR